MPEQVEKPSSSVPKAAEPKIRVTEESLRQTVTAVLEKMGETSEDAAEGADALVMTDLRGMEIQGVTLRLPKYVEQYRSRSLKPRPNWRIVREMPGTASVDADFGLQIILASRLMDIAIEKARNVGLGAVTVYNGGDSGALGNPAMRAASADMIGLAITTSAVTPELPINMVLPTFGGEPRFSTNPMAFAAPARKEPPFLYDGSASASAHGTQTLAYRDGSTVPGGLIAELDGTPIMHDTPARKEGEFWWLPLGSTREMGSNKGYALSMISETLTGLLAGVVPAMVDTSYGSKHFLAAYNIAAFTDVDTFKDNMDKMLRTLRETKPAPGHDRVVYPGLGAFETEKERRANGIPLRPETIKWVEDLTNELSLPGLKTL